MVQVYRHQFVPVAEENFQFISRARKSTPPPTFLTIGLMCFKDRTVARHFVDFYPFAIFTIQMAELDPVLMKYLPPLGQPKKWSCTWSCTDYPSSPFSILTAHLDETFDVERGKALDCTCTYQVVDRLKESVGQTVNLGLGDVAVEVAFTESLNINPVHRVDTVSLIFGGYFRSTYTSVNETRSVFHLGRIVFGHTDFSFIRHFVEPNRLLPVEAKLCVCAK